MLTNRTTLKHLKHDLIIEFKYSYLSLVFQIEFEIGLESIRLDLDSSNFFFKRLESKKIIAFSSRDFNSLLEKSIKYFGFESYSKKTQVRIFFKSEFWTRVETLSFIIEQQRNHNKHQLSIWSFKSNKSQPQS